MTTTESWSEEVEAWVAAFDSADTFGPLEGLRAIRDRAPSAARQHPLYHYLKGIIDGRAIHEELGGLRAAECA